MKTRSLAILSIIGLGFGAGGYFLSDTGPAVMSETQQAGRLLFPGLTERLATAQRITVTRQDKTLTVDRLPGDRWGIAERNNYPARTERIRELLTGLTELRLTEARTTDPTQWDRLGVEDPTAAGSTANLLRVLNADGKPLVELIVGRRRVRTQGNLPESIYVRRPGENQTWLAEGRLLVDADSQLWLDRDIANIPGARVMRVEVSRGGHDLTIARNADGVLGVSSEQAATDPYKLEDSARAFEMLAFIDVTPAAQIPGERIGSSVFTLDNGVRITAQVMKHNDEVWAQLSADGTGDAATEAAQLQARFAGWAFRVGAWKEQALTPQLSDLLSAPRPAITPPAEAPRE